MTERNAVAAGRTPGRHRTAPRRVVLRPVLAVLPPTLAFAVAAALLILAGYYAALLTRPDVPAQTNTIAAPTQEPAADPVPPPDELPAPAADPEPEPAASEVPEDLSTAGPVARAAERARERAEQASSIEVAPAVAPPVGIEIPALDIAQDFVGLQVSNAVLQVPRDYGAIGWWRGGPKPGDRGAAVVVGHVDSPDGPAVFYRLSGLEPGHQISVPREDGSVAVFQVTRVERYARDDFPSEEVYRSTGHPGLNLLTCGGEYNRAAGQYEDNVVVFTDLVSDTAVDA